MLPGDRIDFGDYTWRILDVHSDRVLLITENIIALRWYHSSFTPVTWADCALREYLNGEFYSTFNAADKTRILPVHNHNADNPWFHTEGGADTTDHIFLLSLEEVCAYFGDSSAPLQHRGTQRWQFADAHNANRQAKYNGNFHWWRLRSPGYYNRTSASVSADGSVYVRGNGVSGTPKDGGGLRPALWLKR